MPIAFGMPLHSPTTSCQAERLALLYLADVLNLTTGPYTDPYLALVEARRLLQPLAGLSPVVTEVMSVLDVQQSAWSDPALVARRIAKRRLSVNALLRASRGRRA